RFCSGLDFWSINDHAMGLTPWKWKQTVDAIRQCDAIAGETSAVTAFLGWEWTQVGLTPENHYGHKNVVLRGLSDAEIPDRPIAAASDRAIADDSSSRTLAGVLGVFKPRQDIFDLLRTFDESNRHENCPPGIPVREQAPGCRDVVATPADLFARLDDWGFDSIVIPHGTSWGAYTPPGASWNKQLVGSMHDPARQTLVEVFSGHGSSEEYRPWRAVEYDESGRAFCPEPRDDYLHGCWRAGELIAERCLAAGESAAECDRRAASARQQYVEAGLPGHRVVRGARPEEWLDADQCSDCFQPAFRYRPGGSVQAILALRDFADPTAPRRFDLGLIASSDNHTARPGTGYKEFGRTRMTDARLMHLGRVLDPADARDDERPAESTPYITSGRALTPAEADAERGASFFGTGGLVAVHAGGRDRDAIWTALERKEVYGTSGPQILLWFDLLNPDSAKTDTLPMGGETAMSTAPRFRVRAAGSFEQLPGCPGESVSALGPERLDDLCGGQCDHPSDVRRAITRIEVIRIRPQVRAGEPLDGLIEDPWRVISCDDPTQAAGGCSVEFIDEEFSATGRDTLYYVRAIEAPSLAIGANAQGCERDAKGRCVSLDACGDRPPEDDCLSFTEERAWSSPIFVAHGDQASLSRPR
ncbi:MAG: DUF3604 domain-containing protein, partial [Gemmatimonadetes bacterium]|nr:DUF3604 domain-containing protein [Gemmatimonadota bacterium]